MAWTTVGCNFRSSSAGVVESTNEVALLSGHAYSDAALTLAGGAETVKVGYLDFNWNYSDRDNGVDRRMTGMWWANTTDRGIKISLAGADNGPGLGQYALRVAMGDTTNAQISTLRFYDGARGGGSPFLTLSGNTVAAGRYFDASGVLRTSPSDWATNNVAINHTFVNDFMEVTAGTDLGTETACCLAHFQLSFLGSGVDLAGGMTASATAAGVIRFAKKLTGILRDRNGNPVANASGLSYAFFDARIPGTGMGEPVAADDSLTTDGSGNFEIAVPESNTPVGSRGLLIISNSNGDDEDDVTEKGFCRRYIVSAG